MRRLALALAALLVVAAISVAFFARAIRPSVVSVDVATLRGTPIVPPKNAPDFALVDGDGRPARLIDASRITWLFFGYTHCPDACPLALAALGKAYRTLEIGRAQRTRIVFVTVDPARDTPAVVRAYARAFDPHIAARTGSRETLARAWEAYGIRVDAKTREISHGDAIYAIDRSAHVVAIYPASAAVADLAADMRALAP